MTAVVGILNKRAVAIAADSAATINNKIYNKALKIFTLSKYQPVAVTIYNSESFMSIPLETIIKMYRANLGEGKFDTVEEYKNDFINYLKDQNFFHSSDSGKKYFIDSTIFLILNYLVNEVKANPATGADTVINSKLNEAIINYQISNEVVTDFATYSRVNFDADFNNAIDSLITNLFVSNGITLPAATISVIKQFLYDLLLHKEALTNQSGLVFTGFGDAEIYPSMHSIILHAGFDGRLKYYDDRSVHIVHDMNSSIQQFAQTAAMSTILVGIAPDLEKITIDNFKLFLTKYNTLLTNQLAPTITNIGALIGAINMDNLVNEFKTAMQDAKQTNYINRLMDAVASLAKEDLAEMAESLIYLTYLQKRITFAQEDVGGAVDVALISKGDGFIWIKRKHYFDPKLNQHFFDNYFND